MIARSEGRAPLESDPSAGAGDCTDGQGSGPAFSVVDLSGSPQCAKLRWYGGSAPTGRGSLVCLYRVWGEHVGLVPPHPLTEQGFHMNYQDLIRQWQNPAVFQDAAPRLIDIDPSGLFGNLPKPFRR